MKPLKDSLIYLTGEAAAKALPFLLLPYLTRRFGAAGFGDLSYWQTVCALLAIVFGLSQDGAIARYFYVYGRRNLPAVMLAGSAHTAAALAAALLFAAAAHSPILAAVSLAAAAQTVLAAQLALRQCQKRALQYTLIQAGSGILSALLTVLLLETLSAQPAVLRFAALFLGNAAVSLAACLAVRPAARRPTWRRIRQAAGYIAAFGVPLLLHHASIFAKGQLDRIVIYQSYPAADLGVYAAGLQLAAVLSVLLLAANKAVVPYFYQALKQGSLNAAKVRRLALSVLPLVPLPALTAWLLPDALYPWLLGAQYAGAKYYAVLFLIGFALSAPYYILVNFLFYHGENRRIAQISALSAAVYLAALAAAAQLPNGIRLMPLAVAAANAAMLPLLFFCVREKNKKQAA